MAILGLVVGAESRIVFLDGPPPPFVIAIPPDRVLQSVGELGSRAPAKRPELRRVQAIAPVVAWPIGHRLDQGFRAVHERENLAREVKIAYLVAPADVVHLACLAARDE